MTVVVALVVFTVGLALGAAVTVGIYLLRARGSSLDAELARNKLGDLLAPLRDELERYDQRLSSFDRERAMQFGAISEQMHIVTAASEGLRDQTQQLASALRNPNVRGRWGEVQLRRVVELAGMAEHCDFDTQVTATSETEDGESRRFRPDMIVRLPGDRVVIIDAKTPLTAYLDATTSVDDRERARLLRAHATHVRAHMEALARKGYRDPSDVGITPEFVVLFLPGEAFFSAALEVDPSLIEDSASRGVILATPTTLIALLRGVAFGWREARMTDSAREIAALGGVLYDRLAMLSEHFNEVGIALDRAVTSYNRAVGSLESRVLVSARRFRELGAAADQKEIAMVTTVGSRARTPQASDLASPVVRPLDHHTID